MSLEVAIEKQVSDFRLAVQFTAEGAPLGLLGSSGSGKTMTLRAIAGLESPDRGRIVLHGRVLFDSERRINLPARERRVGLLFQNYALFPHLTVAENIAFGLRRLSRTGTRTPRRAATRRRTSGWPREPVSRDAFRRRAAARRAGARPGHRARGPAARRTVFRSGYAPARRSRTATPRNAG